MTVTIPSTELAKRWDSWEREPKPNACRWGIPWVERALGPSPMPGSTVIVGAGSNVGKTFFSLALLRGMAESGPAVFLSLEDPELELSRRMSASGYAHPNLHVAFPDPGQVLRAFDDLARSPLRPVAIGIDYAQCVAFDLEGLTHFINGVRARSRETGIVSVVASQINSPPPGVEDKGVPHFSRCKGARTIGERADVAFMMANGKEHLIVEIGKAKGCATGARARYARGPGGRLVYVETQLDLADE